MRSSRAGARRDIVRRFQIGSTAHDPHRPVATLQCCSQSPLLVDRRRACSANDHSHAPARNRSHDNRNSFIASPGSATTLSRGGPHLAVTTATPQPIARASQIPIAPARRTVLPMPARGFLPRGLSDACPRSAPHRQVTGRHLITLNDSGHWRDDGGATGFDLKRKFNLALFGSHKPNFGRSPLTATVTLILPAHAIAQRGIAVWFRVSPEDRATAYVAGSRDTTNENQDHDRRGDQTG